MKECRQCGTAMPLSEFPLDKSRKDGYHPYCRRCKSEKQRSREHKKTESRQEARRIERTCHRCKNIKSISEFDGKYHNMVFGYVICRACSDECYEGRKARRNVRSKVTYTNNRNSISVRGALRRREIKTELARMISPDLSCQYNGCDNAVCDNTPIECFDFHHIDKKNKEINMAHAYHVYQSNKDDVILEVLKCKFVCAICHRKYHTILMREDNHES